ncbi:MAG: right-handed parallel beta-helix repeat-containing protein, partial [Nanoarchaeota archaeon]
MNKIRKLGLKAFLSIVRHPKVYLTILLSVIFIIGFSIITSAKPCQYKIIEQSHTPIWIANSILANNSRVDQNMLVNFSANWSDNSAILDSFIFELNQSGSYRNSSSYTFGVAGSQGNVSTNISYINASEGFNVTWRFWANNSGSVWNSTNLQSLVVDCTDIVDELTITGTTFTTRKFCPRTYENTDTDNDGIIRVRSNNTIINCNGASFRGNQTLTSPSKRVFDLNGNYNITIENCDIRQYRDGIRITASNNVTVSNVTFNHSRNNLLVQTSSTNILAISNRFYGAELYQIAYTNVHNSTVQFNTFQTNITASNIFDINVVLNLTIAYNNFTWLSDTDATERISIAGSEKVYINNNNASRLPRFVQVLNTTDMKFYNNWVFNSTSNVAYVFTNNSKIEIFNETIILQDRALDFEENNSNVTIRNNFINASYLDDDQFDSAIDLHGDRKNELATPTVF